MSLDYFKNLLRGSRSSSKARSQRAINKLRRKTRSILLEPLESRLAMATINYTVGDPTSYASNPQALIDGDIDLTIRLANVGGSPVLQLVDNDLPSNNKVVGSSPLDEPIIVNITGSLTDIAAGQSEEFVEALRIDLANTTGLVLPATSITVTFNGRKGTALSLLKDDTITIDPSTNNVYSPTNLTVTMNDGESIIVDGPVNATGNITLQSNQGAIDILASGSIATPGNVFLNSIHTVNVNGDTDSLDALAMLSPKVNVAGSISGRIIGVSANANGTVTINPTDLNDGQFSVGALALVANTQVNIDGNAALNATQTLNVLAVTNITTSVTRGTQDDGDANDDDKDQDAALALSIVTSGVAVRIRDQAQLNSQGSLFVFANNTLNVTTTSDGTLKDGQTSDDSAGGTVATATIVGDTEIVIEDNASFSAVNDIDISSTSSRGVTTTSIATKKGATDDGDSNTTTAGQAALADNNASTSDGEMTLAAAIAVNTVMGETRTLINGGTFTSQSGTIKIESSSNNNIQTIADGTTTTGDNGTGVGVAVAIGLAGVTDPNGATGIRTTARVNGTATFNAPNVIIEARAPENVFNTSAVSGASGPSKDENGNSTGADIGVAGSLAIGVTITNTTADLAPTANVNTSGANVTIASSANSIATVQAIPKGEPATGESLGLGAGVAINITDHTTASRIDNGASLTGANDLSISASSIHDKNTLGKAGAAGGLAIAAAVAVEMGHDDTFATIGTGGTLNTTGDVAVTAMRTPTLIATAAGDAKGGSDAAVGAAVAVRLNEDQTIARVNRSLISAGNFSLNATNSMTTNTVTTASSKGETDSGNEDDANAQNQAQRDAADSQASSRGARGSDQLGDNPDAGTDQGSMNVAAAISLNLIESETMAEVASGVVINADREVTITSSSTHQATSIADGSANKSENGIGAAVAINSVHSENTAVVRSGATIIADEVSIIALSANGDSNFSAESTSGAGASKLGIAGSLAINLIEANSNATLESGSQLQLVDGDDIGFFAGSANVAAYSVSNNFALAKSNATGDTGVGASLAFNITDLDTLATVADNAVITGATSLLIDANSNHDVTTKADGGATGGTSIVPVGAATLSFHTTEAKLGKQNGTLTTLGNATITARASGVTDADALGKTTGSDAAIGASLGVTYVDESVDARTERNITTGGSLTIRAESDSSHTTNAVASASGADGEKKNQDGTVQDKSDSLRASGNSKSTAHSGSTSGTDNKATATTASKDGNSSGDALTVAAAIAVSVVEKSTKAQIVDGLTVQSGGLLTVESLVDSDSITTADGSASKGDIGIGAAVAINVVDVDNIAEVGAANITTDGLVVRASVPTVGLGLPGKNTMHAKAVSGAGGEDVGVAGSLSINHLEMDTAARIKSNAVITLDDGGDADDKAGKIAVLSQLNTVNTSEALPDKTGGASGGVGIGASVALNLTYFHSDAEIGESVTWNGDAAQELDVIAGSDHTTTTVAENGAKGGDLGIGGAVAVVVTKNHTNALVGSSNTAIHTAGNASVHTDHRNQVTTNVSSAATGGDASIGASVGVVVVEDIASAILRTDLVVGRDSSVESKMQVESILNVKASAGGGDSGGNDADTEATNQANQPNASTNGSNTLPSAKDETQKANNESSDESGSTGGGIGIAASVAVNTLSLKNAARVAGGASIHSIGSVAISAPAHVVARAEADSTAVDISGDGGIGAAVALNVASLTNEAIVEEGSSLTGNGVTIEAYTIDALTNDFSATAFAVAGNTGDFAVSGVAAINIVDVDSHAILDDNAHVVSSSDASIIAENDMRAQAVAIAGAGSTGASVAAAVAINVLGLNEEAEKGGSNTIASVGRSQTNKPAASLEASGAATVSASHKLGMFPLVDLPDSLNNPEDPDDAIEDIDVETFSIAVSGGGSTGDFAAAGSASINLLESTTQALVSKGATVQSGSLDLVATDTTAMNTLAGALSVAAGGAGIGLGLDLNIVHKSTLAEIAPQATVTTSGHINIHANSAETITSVAATAGAGQSVGAAGSAGVQVIETTTKATIADGLSKSDAASVQAGGLIDIEADGVLDMRLITGAVGAGGKAGFGASAATIVHNDHVEASVGNFASVTTSTGLTVDAYSKESIVAISAAGAGGGTVGVAGAAVVNTLNEKTIARIGDGTEIVASNGDFMLGTPNVKVIAVDATEIVSVGGSLAAAGSVAAGIGADVGKIDKSTQASIGSGVIAEIEGNLVVDAQSTEDVTSVAAGLAASATAAFSLDASVHVYDIKTRAFIGDDPLDGKASLGAGNIHAQGSISVSADSANEIDKVVGVAAVSGTGAVAGGAGVSTVTKTTEAFIGENAKLQADGKNEPITARTGKFVLENESSSLGATGIESNDNSMYGNNIGDLKGSGEIGSPEIESTSDDQDRINDADDPAFKEQERTMTPELASFRGISVTATNRDDIEVYSMSLAGATGAVAISAAVNVVDTKTRAYVGKNAELNQSNGQAHDDQSVRIVANNDFSHVAFAGSVAAGAAGIAPAADVSVIKNQTEAYLGWDATNSTTAPAKANAKEDLLVAAHATEDIVLVGVGIAGGFVGIGAGANFLVFNQTTNAAIGSNAVVNVDGDAIVLATDDSDLDVIAGGGGGGFVGAGGAIGVMSLNKDTNAWIDSGASVNALGKGPGFESTYNGETDTDGVYLTQTAHGVIVQSRSSEDIFNLALAVGGGAVGVAGGILVTDIASDASAEIRDEAKINSTMDPTKASPLQSVFVNAVNETEIITFSGAFAGGLAALGGAVNVGTLKNDTNAKIGDDAQVIAKLDVEVNALGNKDIDDFTFSGSGGAVGLAGTVSVWSIGTPLRSSYSDEAGNEGKAMERKEGAADKDATDQAQYGRDHLASSLNAFQAPEGSHPKSNAARLSSITGLASSKLLDSAPNSQALGESLNDPTAKSGTTAAIGDFAIVTAGDDIDVTAHERVDIDINTGGFAAGLAGFGAAVSVLSVSANTSAYSGGNLTAGGDVTVQAILDETVDTTAMAGGAGFVGVGAAVVDIHESSVVQAAVGTVYNADTVEVLADANQSVNLTTGQLGAGGLAGGASFTRLVADGEVAAGVLGGAQIGKKPGSAVGTLSVTADSTINAINETTAVAFGVVAVSVNFATAEVKPEVQATVGFGANINATSLASVHSIANHNAKADVLSLTGGAISIGTSFATASLGGEVKTTVESAASIEGGSVNIDTWFNHNVVNPTLNQATASAMAPSPVPILGLAAGTGTFANASANTNVSTTVNEDAVLRATAGNVLVRSVSSHVADAEGLAVSTGLVAAIGVTETEAIANGQTKTNMNGKIQASNGITIVANATNLANAEAEAASIAGGAGAAGANAYAEASPIVESKVDASGFVVTGGLLDVALVANNTATTNVSGNSFALGTGGTINGMGPTTSTAKTNGTFTTKLNADADANSASITGTVTSQPTANGFSAAGGFIGSGSAVVAEVESKPDISTTVNGKLDTLQTTHIATTHTNTPQALANTIALAAGAADGGAMATVESKPIVHTQTQGASITAPAGLNVLATDTTNVTSYAGAATLGLGAALGNGLATNDVAADVLASVTNGIHFANNVQVHATSTGNYDAQANGLVAGGLSLAGGVATNNIANKTSASIKDDVFVNWNAPGFGDISVQAIDNSSLKANTDLASIGLGADGAAMSINNAANQVEGFIGNVANVATNGNVIVKSDALTKIDTLSVGISAGGVSIAGNTAINSVANSSKASVANQANVVAANNVLVQSNIDNAVSSTTGNAALGLIGAGGTSIIHTYENDNQAFVDANSSILAQGNGPSLTIPRWNTFGTLVNEQLNGLAVIASTNERPSIDPDGNGPLGLTTINALNASGGIAGFAAVEVVSASNNNTEAYIASSNINNEEKFGQDVIVRAHSAQEQSVRTRTDAGGFNGESGAKVRTHIAGTTRAFISDNNETGSDITLLPSNIYGNDIEVNSVTRERIDLDGQGVTGGNATSAGVAAISEIGVTSQSFVRDSKVVAYNDLQVLASDNSDIYSKVQAASLGFAGIAGGTAIGFNTIKNNVKSQAIGADLFAARDLTIQATSTEDILSQASSVGAAFVGLAGTVVLNTIETDTESGVLSGDSSTMINVNIPPAANTSQTQTVTIAADDIAVITNTQGSDSGGLVGSGAAVEIGNIRNRTVANVGTESTIHSSGEIDVTANSQRNLDSEVSSFAGGFAGLSGAVSVLNVGTPDALDLLNMLAEFGKADKNGVTLQTQVNSPVENNDMTTAVDDGSTGIANTLATQAASKVNALANTKVQDLITAPLGRITAATIEDASNASSKSVLKGNLGITVQASNEYTVNQKAGSDAAGVAAFGAATAITSLHNATGAELGKHNVLLSTGDVSIRASDINRSTTPIAIAANGGAGGAVASSNDNQAKLKLNSDTTARVDQHAVIEQAEDLTIEASQVSTLIGNSTGFGFAGAAASGDVAVNATYTLDTISVVEDNAVIGGEREVMSLTMSSTSVNTLDNNVKVGQGAVGIGSANGSAVTVITTKTETQFGDANANVRNQALLSSNGIVNVQSDLDAFAAAFVGDGSGTSSTTISGTIASKIADGASFQSGSLNINANQNSSIIGDGQAIGGGVAGGIGSAAKGSIDVDVVSSLGAAKATIDGSVAISSNSIASVETESGSVAVVGFGKGSSEAESLITGSVQAVVHGAELISGGSVSILADAHNTATANSTATSVGIVNGNAAKTYALVDVDTSAQVQTSIVNAKDAIQVDANSTNQADTYSEGWALGLLGAVGSVSSEAYVEGSTRALADGEIHSLTDGIRVRAHDDQSHAAAEAKAAGGGLGIATSATKVRAAVQPSAGDNQAQVRARLAGNVSAKADIDVVAESTDAYATAMNHGVTLSLTAAGTQPKSGGTDTEAVLAQSIRSSIGNGSTVVGGGNVHVSAINDALWSTSTSEAVSGALVAGFLGANAVAKSVASVQSVIGDATIKADGDIHVTSQSQNLASAIGDGVAIGGIVAVGDVHATATAGNETIAEIQSGANLQATNLLVSTLSQDRGKSKVTGTGGGLVSDNSTNAKTNVEPTVAAKLGDNVVVNADQDIHISAESRVEGDAHADANSFGAVAIGESRATVNHTPVVTSSLGTNAQLIAGHDIVMESTAGKTAPIDGSGASRATAEGASASAFFGELATKAQVFANPTVHTTVAPRTTGNQPTFNAGNHIRLTSDSTTNALSEADNAALSLTASHGYSIADSIINSSTQTQIGSNALLKAVNDITVESKSKDYADSSADSLAGSVVKSEARSESRANIDHQTKTHIDGAQLEAGDTIDVSSLSDSRGISYANADSGSVIGSSNANAGRDETDLNVGGSLLGTVIKGVAKSTIGSNTSLKATDVHISASIEKSDGESISDARAAIGPADIDAVSRVELYDDALVDVKSGATITGTKTVKLAAETKTVRVNSDVVTKADGFGGAHSDAIGHVDTDARVTTESNSTINTHDLSVQAFGMTGDTYFHNDATATGAPNGETEKGDFDPDRNIDFDADVNLSSGNAVLIIGLNGLPVVQENIDYHVVGNTIVVHDVVNNNPGSALFQTNTVSNAPKGLVRSMEVALAQAAGAPIVHGVGPTFTFKETFDEVRIENLSNMNLEINNIGVVNKTAKPEVTIDTQSIAQQVPPAMTVKEVFGFDVAHTFGETSVNISDPIGASPSTITLKGIIDNPIGETTIINKGGSVAASGGAQMIRTNNLDIEAAGFVGSAGSPVRTQLVQSMNRPTSLDVDAGGEVQLNLQGLVRESGTTSFSLADAQIDGSSVNVTMQDALVQNSMDNSVSYLVDVHETHPVQTTAVENRFRPASPGLPSLTNLDLGIFGVGATTGDASYEFDLIQTTSNGNIALKGVAAGKKIHVDADTNAHGTGKVDVSVNGNIDITELAGDLRVGSIDSSSGDVVVTTINGNILDADNDFTSDVTGNHVNLVAPLGAIGTVANALEVNSSVAVPASLNATAKDSIVLVETVGTLNTGVVESKNGNVNLATINGAIVDANNDSAANVIGKDVSLDANGGAGAQIGELNDSLELCATGVVTLTADGGIPNVKNLCGKILIKLIQVGLGSVNIASAGGIELVDGALLQAAGDINLDADLDVLFAPNAVVDAGGKVKLRAGLLPREGEVGAKIITDGNVFATQFDILGGDGHDQILMKHEMGRGFTEIFAGLGNDLIDGTELRQQMKAHGGRGHDIIFSGEAIDDLLFGDEGDDIIHAIAMGQRVIDGGLGFDTFKTLGAGLLMDLTRAPAGQMSGLESLDIIGSGHNNVTLNPQTVRDLSDETDTLVVRRNYGDRVNIGNGWQQLADERIGSEWFNVYRQGQSMLKIQKMASPVVGRYMFYNNSFFDGNNRNANAADDGAIATDKQAYTGGPITHANYSNYSRGINGIMVDIADLPAAGLTLADFEFRVGNSDTPANWGFAPTPASISVRRGAGVGGSTRVTIIWNDNAIEGKWLEIRVLANSRTGLLMPDVFYFGNAPGEVADGANNAIVNATDVSRTVSNQNNFLNPASIANPFDFNRDRFVNASDIAIATSRQTSFLTALRWLNATVDPNGDRVGMGNTWQQLADERIGSDWFNVYRQGQSTLKIQKVASPVVGQPVDNNSYSDGDNRKASAAADRAIATDKRAFIGGPVMHSNHSNNSRGANDLPAAGLTLADSEFKVDKSESPADWTLAPSAASTSVRRGADVGGSAGTNPPSKLNG